MCQNTGILYIFTCKCASRYSGVQFFDIRTSKSVPNTTCFVHFHFHMCFSPSACNFSTSELQKVLRCRQFFISFSLQNVCCATAECNFSTSELQKVLRCRQFFNIFTSKRAFRHSGVQFFDIRTSKRLRTPHVLYIFTSKCAFRIFSQQRRAIFRHGNFKKCSGAVSLFIIFTSKCVLRHSGVQFFDIRTSKSAPVPSVF